MPYPPQTNMELPLLKVIAENGGQITLDAAVKGVTAHYGGLTEEDIESRLDSGEPKWKNRIRWVRLALVQKGDLDSSIPGIWKITSKGKERIHNEWDSWHPRYLEPKSSKPVIDRLKKEETFGNPYETIQEAHNELIKQLANDIIIRAFGITPSSFEYLIAELLSKMGYGRPKVVGRSGDGGVDGECSLDKLGLYRVLFQAKRWKKPVTASEVRDFIGAIRTKRVEYGIFATTSSFTKDAHETAEKSANVKLIDGEELGRLLIKHNLGVTVQLLELPRISEDFFSSL